MSQSASDDAFWAFLDKVEPGGISDYVDIPSWHRTREGFKSVVNNGIETEPLLYAENPWQPDREDDVRSAAVVVGFRERRGEYPHKTIVLSFQGKDVHSGVLTPYQARGLALLLDAYADFVDPDGKSTA